MTGYWLGVVSWHDTSVRRYYKSEHWAPSRIQTLSSYDWKKKHVKNDIKPEHPNNFNRDLNRCLHTFSCYSDVKATPLFAWNIRLCTRKMPPVQLANWTEDLGRNNGHSRINYVSGCRSDVKSYCLEIHVHVVNVVKRTSVQGVQPYFKRWSLLPCSSTLCH